MGFCALPAMDDLPCTGRATASEAQQARLACTYAPHSSTQSEQRLRMHDAAVRLALSNEAGRQG